MNNVFLLYLHNQNESSKNNLKGCQSVQGFDSKELVLLTRNYFGKISFLVHKFSIIDCRITCSTFTACKNRHFENK